MGKQPTRAAIGSAGVVETARSEGIPGNVGDPQCARVATSIAVSGGGAERESDGRIVPLKPGNAGEGKAPDFRHAFR